MRKINRKNLYEHLLERQFNLVEKTIFDAFINKNWSNEWFITTKQYEKFKKYAISTIKGVLKCSSSKSTKAFEEFRLYHGITIKD